ncbi:hypothetical protein BJ875DRAFT_207330 [Amylocarpus encephaloides]|uniref:DUF676 domain-containing protein n=1 Tax=Amylocarpus encephaloides TaxID=45428 RepID=A0A9P7YA08_9HELO|nr:hypothetical protein BJ875DRAFT_207330 [Amylocarpus encephaloides]
MLTWRRVVMVHGLMGPKRSNVPLWVEHWIPPDSTDNFITLHWSPSSIVGRDSSEGGLEREARKLLRQLNSYLRDAGPSYVLWAEDMGGAIVKLALTIAAREARYRRVLDAIPAVVFFGTPHRASSTHSLDSTVLAVIEACYSGLLGDWLPATINTLSRQLEGIHERFSLISHQFSIISHYQRSSFSTPCHVIVTEECATLGLENEITIGCNRPPRDMENLMNWQEESTLQIHLINIKIAHWERFKHFLNILESTRPKRELEGPVLSLPRSTKVMARCSRDSELVDWVSSENAPRYMKVAIGSTVDPSKLLNSMAGAMWKYPDTLWLACPSVDLGDASGILQDEVGIYAGLLQQVLTQQPRAFLHMQHLVSILTDAIRGHAESWKQRALWLCLRTVIQAPIGVSTYGFLHVNTSTSINVLRQVDSALQGTESMFRLVLAFTEGLPAGFDDLECIGLDFESEDLEDCHLVDTNLLSKAPANLTVKRDTPSTGSIEETMQRSTTSKNIPLQLLALRIQALGRPIFIALTWTAFATRPLSIDELDLVLAFDDSADSGGVSTLADFAHGSAFRLPKLLPDVVSIKLGRVFLLVSYAEMRHTLSQLSQIYLAPGLSPHLYIAQSCVIILLRHVLKAPEKGGAADDVKDTKFESDDSSDDSSDDFSDDSSSDTTKIEQEKTKQPNPETIEAPIANGLLLGQDETHSSDQVEPQQWAVDKMTDCQRILAEYTARNWMVHYKAGRGE